MGRPLWLSDRSSTCPCSWMRERVPRGTGREAAAWKGLCGPPWMTGLPSRTCPRPHASVPRGAAGLCWTTAWNCRSPRQTPDRLSRRLFETAWRGPPEAVVLNREPGLGGSARNAALRIVCSPQGERVPRGTAGLDGRPSADGVRKGQTVLPDGGARIHGWSLVKAAHLRCVARVEWSPWKVPGRFASRCSRQRMRHGNAWRGRLQ